MAERVAANASADLRGMAYTLGLISLVLVLIGIGVAYAIDAAGRGARLAPHRLDSSTILTRTIGGRTLTIPLSWFRDAEDGEEGFSKQVDLLVRLPVGPAGALRAVDVALVPRSTVRASARLLDGVYLHRFEQAEVVGPSGLIGKPLKGTEGYAAETVWYDPISADPFVAKCEGPIQPAGRGECLRIVYLAPALAAVYRFPVDALHRWRDFDPQLNPMLQQIGALDR